MRPRRPGEAIPLRERLILALDEADFPAARAMVERLGPSVETFKVGVQLFTACGPGLIEWLRGQGRSVFLDLKFHDIPAVAARAIFEAARLGAFMIDVHASGGLEMMKACQEAVASIDPRPLLLAVTVLTSLDAEDLRSLGVSRPLEEQALHLTDLALQAGLAGVVASPREASAIRKRFGKSCLIVTPGVRPAGLGGGPDQKRVATAGEAMAAGADYLVVGRPIREAKDPREAAEEVLREMAQGLREAEIGGPARSSRQGQGPEERWLKGGRA